MAFLLIRDFFNYKKGHCLSLIYIYWLAIYFLLCQPYNYIIAVERIKIIIHLYKILYDVTTAQPFIKVGMNC